MNAVRPRPRPLRHLAWALCFAWLLPLAQLAATWHELSHVDLGAPASSDTHKQALHLTHCDLCLSAAAVAGGAPLATRVPLVLAATRDALPQRAVETAPGAAPLRAYRSRAPPLALR